jgi:hypothetical protein
LSQQRTPAIAPTRRIAIGPNGLCVRHPTLV